MSSTFKGLKSLQKTKIFVVSYFLEDGSCSILGFKTVAMDSNGGPGPQHRLKASKCPEKLLKPKSCSIIHVDAVHLYVQYEHTWVAQEVEQISPSFTHRARG